VCYWLLEITRTNLLPLISDVNKARSVKTKAS